MSSNYPSFGNGTYHHCQRCGKPLGPNEVQCNNCGFFNAPQQGNAAAAQPPSGPAWGNTVPQPLSPTEQQWQPQPAQPAPGKPSKGQFVPQLPFGPTNPLYPGSQQSASPSQRAPVPQQSFTPAPPSQPLAAPPAFGGYQPGAGNFNTFSQPSAQPPSQPLGSSSPFGGAQPGAQPLSQPLSPQLPAGGWSAGIGGLNGSPSTGFSQAPTQFPPGGFQAANGFSAPQTAWGQPPSGMLNPSDDKNEQKRGPRIGLIIGLLALVVLILGGSFGGYLYIKSRSSAPAQATPTPTPLPSPTGTPLFSDQFANNNNGWDLTSKSGQFSVKVGNGSLVLEDDNNKLLWEMLPGGKNFSDFFLTVDANLSKGTQGNGYGIYIRGTSDQSLDIATYYRFEIYGDGTYALFKGTVDASAVSNSQTLIGYTTNSIIHPAGKVNHIAISAKGAAMTFYVNGQKLKTVIDNTYASGSIALFVSNLPQAPSGAAVTFSNLMIYPPQPWA